MVTPEDFRAALARYVTAYDPHLVEDALEEYDGVLQQVWDNCAEAYSDWMWNNPTPAGIPIDPPRNPYEDKED